MKRDRAPKVTYLVGWLLILLAACEESPVDSEGAAQIVDQSFSKRSGEQRDFAREAGRDLGAGPDGAESADRAGSADASHSLVDRGNSPPQFECMESSPAAPRLALAFPYGEEVGVDGEVVQLYTLTEDGPIPLGERLMIGGRPGALSFSPDGHWLLILEEEGRVTSVDLRGEAPALTDVLELPSGSFRAITAHPSARRFDLPNGNSNEAGGLYAVDLDCEGQLSLAFEPYSLRLSFALRRAAARPEWAIVLGGQAVFEPADPVDLRLLREEGEGWREVSQLDLYTDYIDAEGVAFSTGGDWAGVVNGSPFSTEGGQVRIISVDLVREDLEERARFEGLADVRRARFTPRGDRLIVSQLEPGRVQLFNQGEAGEWRLGERIEGIGLADDFAMSPPSPWASNVEEIEGEGAAWLWVPMTSPRGGSAVARIMVTPGSPVREGPRFELGEGFTAIPGSVAVWPAL